MADMAERGERGCAAAAAVLEPRIMPCVTAQSSSICRLDSIRSPSQSGQLPSLPPRSASASALIQIRRKAPTSATASGAQCAQLASRRRKHASDMRDCSCAASPCVAFAGAGKPPGRSTLSSRTGSPVPRRSPRQTRS